MASNGMIAESKAKAFRFFRSPWASTIITLLIIVTGGIGSVYSTEIKAVYPFRWGPMPFSLEASVFWFLAIVTSCAFYFRQKADDAHRHEAQERVLDRARELERLVRTLPPANFLSVFSQLYNTADKMESVAFGLPTEPIDKEVLEKCTRVVLRLIATLAQTFDGDHSGVRYAANLMMFRPSSDLSAEQKEQIRKRLQFCDDAIGIDNIKGVLDLHPKLSTTAEDDESGPDASVSPLAIPIPLNPKVNGRYKILPGAPHAFVDKEPDLYTDTANLRKWCDDHGDFTEEIKGKLAAYFNTHEKTIRSFISIPLFRTSDDGNDAIGEDPIAVLNIHSSRVGLLREQGEPLTHFVSIVRPMQLILTKMILAQIKLSIYDQKD
jgi:hypothetical protein